MIGRDVSGADDIRTGMAWHGRVMRWRTGDVDVSVFLSAEILDMLAYDAFQNWPLFLAGLYAPLCIQQCEDTTEIFVDREFLKVDVSLS